MTIFLEKALFNEKMETEFDPMNLASQEKVKIINEIGVVHFSYMVKMRDLVTTDYRLSNNSITGECL